MLDRVGGLFECGDMGSGDHHMALRMVGKVDASPPGGVTPGYRNAVTGWANLASNAINGKLGFAYGTIEHPSTAASPTAAIELRWEMFLDHGFDPLVDFEAQHLWRAGILRLDARPRAGVRPLSSLRAEDANLLT